MNQAETNHLVSEALERGVNYFDVAPLYGDGEAERMLGAALQDHRDSVFLASKTMERDAAGARRELEQSLRRLSTDHVDLYQFHAVTHLNEVEKIFGPAGAAGTFIKAREEGRVRFIGFSAHSAAAALAMMDRFHFDSIQFPVNFVCSAGNRLGDRVLERAREMGVARIALKSMAHSRWGKNETRQYPNCWYKPIDDRETVRQALRFTLSEDVTSLLPPGDPRLFRMALALAHNLPPLSQQEREDLLATAQQIKPVINL
jgi:aryl-alcohol dehydrogenase-like predicted oxidoreductase